MTRIDVAPRRHIGTRQPHATRQCKWHDSFMSHANRTGMTEKGQIWKKKVLAGFIC
jgi:hypothetical protein